MPRLISPELKAFMGCHNDTHGARGMPSAPDSSPARAPPGLPVPPPTSAKLGASTSSLTSAELDARYQLRGAVWSQVPSYSPDTGVGYGPGYSPGYRPGLFHGFDGYPPAPQLASSDATWSARKEALAPTISTQAPSVSADSSGSTPEGPASPQLPVAGQAVKATPGTARALPLPNSKVFVLEYRHTNAFFQPHVLQQVEAAALPNPVQPFLLAKGPIVLVERDHERVIEACRSLQARHVVVQSDLLDLVQMAVGACKADRGRKVNLKCMWELELGP